MLLVVGGHSRNIGKTSVVAAIISAIPEARWQAVKITQYGHAVCKAEGEACRCTPADPRHPFALDRQETPDSTDSGRYLAAGAVRSWWLRTSRERLGNAIPALKRLAAEWENTILESNSILRYLRPNLYIPVLDFTNADMKDSARLFLDRADAFAVSGGNGEPPWPGLPARWLDKPTFDVRPPSFSDPALFEFVRRKLAVRSSREPIID